MEKMELLEYENKKFELEWRKASAYKASAMLPAHLRDEGSMMVLGQMSKDLKIPMLLLAQNIFMVKGKIGMSAQLVISLINNSDIYDHDLKFEERAEPFGIRAWALKDGERVEGIWIDEQMILDNGWYGNPNWKTLKPLMARYRSATYFARLNCPMVLMGFQTDEEIIDVTSTVEETPASGGTLNQAVSGKPKDPVDPDDAIDVADETDEELEFLRLKDEADQLGISYRKDISYPSLFKKVEKWKHDNNHYEEEEMQKVADKYAKAKIMFEDGLRSTDQGHYEIQFQGMGIEVAMDDYRDIIKDFEQRVTVEGTVTYPQGESADA